MNAQLLRSRARCGEGRHCRSPPKPALTQPACQPLRCRGPVGRSSTIASLLQASPAAARAPVDLLLPKGSRHVSGSWGGSPLLGAPAAQGQHLAQLPPQLRDPAPPHGARRVSAHAVSVPKVLVRPPGQRQMEWVELWESYTYQKVIFIKQAITEDVANNLIALTLHLDSQDKKRIYFWMNCPGGEVVPTLALYDTMQYVKSKTATVCYGLCLGMGGFLLTAGGEKGYRFAMPHSILMMHHPSGASRGQASEMHIESRELVRVRDYLSLLTANATGQPYDRVIRELSRNKWMDPKQAIEYGMIDKVLTTSKPKMPSEGPTFTFNRVKNTAEPGFGTASTDGDAGL